MEKREPIQLKIDGNILNIKTKDRYFICHVENSPCGYFLDMGKVNNSFLFEVADIRDKYLFQREILGYSTEMGGFPYCHTREDVIKLAKAVVGYNNSQLKGNFFLRERKNIKFNFNL